jgi:hypothetical protein
VEQRQARLGRFAVLQISSWSAFESAEERTFRISAGVHRLRREVIGPAS